MLDTEEDKVIEFLKYVVNPKEFFKKYNYFINNYITDKYVAKDKLILVENIIINYLNDQYFGDHFDEKTNEILSKIEEDKLLNILSIIEEELPKLEFNINYKLWIDSLFSKLVIGG